MTTSPSRPSAAPAQRLRENTLIFGRNIVLLPVPKCDLNELETRSKKKKKTSLDKSPVFFSLGLNDRSKPRKKSLSVNLLNKVHFNFCPNFFDSRFVKSNRNSIRRGRFQNRDDDHMRRNSLFPMSITLDSGAAYFLRYSISREHHHALPPHTHTQHSPHRRCAATLTAGALVSVRPHHPPTWSGCRQRGEPVLAVHCVCCSGVSISRVSG
jgi:hypothetical protein